MGITAKFRYGAGFDIAANIIRMKRVASEQQPAQLILTFFLIERNNNKMLCNIFNFTRHIKSNIF